MSDIVAIASDHAGFKLKELIKQHFEDNHINYLDFGTYDEESVDYPDFAAELSFAISQNQAQKVF